MSTSSIQEDYQNRINLFSKRLSELEQKIKIISFARLFTALTGIFTFYLALTEDTSFFYLLLFLSLVFTILVVIHTGYFKQSELTKNYIQLNQGELQYFQQNYSKFDDGKEFINFSHPYTYDLDIFGQDSLFQSIVRTVTQRGKQLLAQTLSEPNLLKNDILDRQECIKELNPKLEFRQKFLATGMLTVETSDDREKIENWMNEKYHFYSNKLLPYLLIIFPVLAFSFLILSILEQRMHPLLSITILINWLIYGIFGKKINRLFSLVNKKKILLGNYSSLFEIVEQEDFKSDKLESLKRTSHNASKEFKSLANYVGWLDQRLNILISPILNSLFLFDLQFCYRIEKWRNKNDRDITPWLEALGHIDFLCSMGNFSYNNPGFIFPEISDGQPYLEAKQVSHPLIKNTKRIGNDFVIGKDNQIAVITGANMAGKSTFLRTIGINIVLAYTGSPVCASSFHISQFNLASSMRISDSLKDDVSYFYAELQRLKLIRTLAETGEPILILLDEMLRGTNSKDKQQGSKAFVENLVGFNCIAMVATHDLLLGVLEDEYPTQIKNYCFESLLNNNQLSFDYSIKRGIAQNTNASFLMKNLGII